MRGVASTSELLKLAGSIGRPVPSPTGELVKELSPRRGGHAHRCTLSDTYGKGSFPLHTDTAFWPVPCRYVIFRVRGDIRRATTILTFADLFRLGTPDLSDLASRSIWLVHTSSRTFYCSMRFRHRDLQGWRYDGQCMSPANRAALIIKERLNPLLADRRAECVSWTSDMAVVLCNWKVLHGRGPSPSDENLRILERIYVE